MQSRSRSSSIGDGPSLGAYAPMMAKALGASQLGGAERKSSFVSRSRSNSAGDEKKIHGSDLIAAYSLGLAEEVLIKQIPQHAGVAALRIGHVREKRSASVGDNYQTRFVTSRTKFPSATQDLLHHPSPEQAVKKSGHRRGWSDSKPGFFRNQSTDVTRPQATPRPFLSTTTVPTLVFTSDAGAPSSTSPAAWPRSVRNSRAATEPALGNMLPLLSIRSLSGSSDDSLDSGCSSSSGLSPRLLQLSHQMSRAYFLEFILHDKKARKAFKNYLEKRHCVENLMFWLDVERFKRLAEKNVDGSLNKDVLHKVNLTHQDRKELAEALKNPHSHSFDRAQKAIFILMIDGTFDYFLNSDSYKQTKRHDNPPDSGRQEAEGDHSSRNNEEPGKDKDAAPKKRGMFSRRNTDAPQPQGTLLTDSSGSLSTETQAMKEEKKKKFRQGALKRRHTVADSKEIGHLQPDGEGHGDNKKCVLM